MDKASPFGPAITHTVGPTPVTDWECVSSRFLQDHTFTFQKKQMNVNHAVCNKEKKTSILLYITNKTKTEEV